MIRKFNPQEIEDFLQKASRKSTPNSGSKPFFAALLLKIQEEWHKILPQGLAEHSFPWKIEKERLLIRADHGIFAQELKFQDQAICETIHRLYHKKLTGIDVHVGPIYSKTNKTKDIMSRDSKMALKKGQNPPHQNKKLLEELIRMLEQQTNDPE